MMLVMCVCPLMQVQGGSGAICQFDPLQLSILILTLTL